MCSRYVVVTGASTGIGHASAQALAKLGCHVFAGVRNDADARRIRELNLPNLVPIRLDVTQPGEIAAAFAEVARTVGPGGLHALVNNAGISVVGPLEFVTAVDFQRQFQVNVQGLLEVTQAFLPLLRQGAGRICMVTSTNGFLAVPFMGPYSASKFAVEALADALRVELAPWHIRVSVVQPGATQTPIWQKSKVENEAMLERQPPECLRLYGGALDRLRKEVEKMERRATPVSEVARCVIHAVTSPRPKTRYRCGSGARAAWVFARWVPDALRDRLIRIGLGI